LSLGLKIIISENKFVKTIKGKNTEVFKRDYTPADMMVHFVSGTETKYTKPLTSRDVIVVNDLFCMKGNI